MPFLRYLKDTFAVNNISRFSLLQTAQNSTAAAPASQNPFMQAAMLQKQPQANVVAEVASTLKISEKDLEAFKADRFICGQVPECPPPPELC